VTDDQGRGGPAHEQAFRLFLGHQAMIHAYIRAIVRDVAAAEDALSDTSIALARAWEGYDPARPFAPWARGIARRVALETLRRWGQHPRCAALDEDVLEALGVRIEATIASDGQGARHEALARCLDALQPPQRDLVRMRYADGLSHQAIASRLARTANAVCVAMHRLHGVLSDCIRRRLESAP
jgi:RNA polymerase sigma-70 factor (ECF subfamily)